MSSVFHDWVPLMMPGASATAGVSLSSNADVSILAVPFKCQVRRVALLYTTTGTAQAVVTFDQRILAGSDTGRVVFATITKAAANKQGKYLYVDPATSVVLNEGDEIVLNVTADVETSAVAWGIVLVERIPETAANQGDMVAG